MKLKKFYATIILSLFLSEITDAQVYSNKEVGKKNEVLADSLKTVDYPYMLPIWGAEVTARGYDIPYSAGLGITYFTQTSELLIDNLFVGFNNGTMYNLDELVRFNNAESWSASYSVRPDIWLFPFLNVYGIIGISESSTKIDAGIYIPNLDNEWQEISSISTTANFKSNTIGLGMTPTIGIGGGWLALDMNMAWTDVDALNKPVFTYVFGPRLGKTFKFKKPEQNIAFWVGGFRVKFSSETDGSLNLNEVIPIDELQGKVDQGVMKVGDAQIAVDDWWDELSAIDRKNPVNIAKYNTANRVLETAGNILNAADAALNDGTSASLQYSLEKNLKDKWNFLVGSQFQLSNHWMLRAEYGFLGSRQQFMTGLQYRFGL